MRAGLFPGQGLEAKVVLAALDREHPRVTQASEALGYDLAERVALVARRPKGVMPTSLAQPGIFVAGIISCEAGAERGESFDILVGHSLGEYTALAAGGSFTFTDGLKLVSARGEAMHRAAAASRGGMSAVLGLDLESVQEIALATDLTIANDNSPSQVVLSGPPDALTRAAQSVRKAGGRSVLLPVAGAYHSVAMLPAVDELRHALMTTSIRMPRVPVVSNVTALPYRAPGEIRQLLVTQLLGRVRFRECLLYLETKGVSHVIDMGPGDVVARLARATIPTLEAIDA